MRDFQPRQKTVKVLKNESNYGPDEPVERLVNEDLNYSYKHLTPMSKPVPNDWLSIEDEFILFLIIKTPLIGMDFIISPDTRFDDGSMVLIFNKTGIPKLDLIKLLSDSSSGNFLKNPNLDFVKIKAFRLEPAREAAIGNMMVDGERVEYGPIQGEVMPKMARVLTGRV
jgi:sphingosine kinase